MNKPIMDRKTDPREIPTLEGYSVSSRMEYAEDIPTSPADAPTIGDIINARYGRRDVMKGALGVTAIAALSGTVGLGSKGAQAQGSMASSFNFDELEAAVDETHHVAEGYNTDILIRWGDPVVPGAPEFDPMNQTAEKQEGQFGYNNDFVGFVPLPAGSTSTDHGILGVNHEYVNAELMFPNYGEAAEGGADTEAMADDKARQVADWQTTWNAERIEIEMAAHGHSVIEVMRDGEGRWTYDRNSPYNRRFSLRSTMMDISGPAAGHDRMKTSYDTTGRRVIGTVNNCAGGVTPYNTILMAEENFHGYFMGEVMDEAERTNHERYGVPGGWYSWAEFHDRFDVGKEPKEPNRFGWMVEYDPYDPTFTPVKRTAMGRFKHEGAESIENIDGRLVAVMGDDQRFDYIYKFVSYGQIDHNNRSNNFGLLDAGQLYVARFNADGTVDWMPLVYGTGPLTPENGFTSQAEVLIETRRAADLLGATPMDRPEDVSADTQNNKIYAMLTSNERRSPDATDPANPRAGNSAGHVLEITVRDGNFANLQDDWDILVLAGDPADEDTQWGPATSENGWFVNPDNSVIDSRGRLWISTDGNDQETSGRADGIWAMETQGEARGSGKHFFRCPVGAEMCGPFFTRDDSTFFVAVQHPGDADGSTFENPITRWPDFQDDMPVRPAVVAITKQGGGPIA